MTPRLTWLLIAGILVAQSCISITMAAINVVLLATLHLVDRSWGKP
jgi:hypothetical protein